MMEKESLKFLELFVNTPSPSSFEAAAQKVWLDYVSKFTTSTDKDIYGNAIAVLNPGGSPRIMLSGHCDEVGFMVRYINDNGFLYFGKIGGVESLIVPAMRVLIHTEKGSIPGVVGRRAPHLSQSEDREKVPKIHELWIDIGAPNKKEAEEIVAVGDAITFDEKFCILRNDIAVAHGFDDKMGAFTVAETLRLLSKEKINAAIYGVSSVREEIGAKGAQVSAYTLNPQIGIVIDVTHATDHPGVNKEAHGEVKLGQGPVIDKGSAINHKVEKMLREVALAEQIPFQRSIAPSYTGTDADAMERVRGGIALGLVSVPNRYMHSPVEMIHLGDLENAAKIVAAFCRKLTPDMDFRP
ncbi:M42 family metallopeptidase [candidate division KSB1 bacterium]|nr:M42 family metallopeptidase [candidate division KSB1 bacterium]